MLIPICGYAEIHYRFRYLPSRLYRKVPEMVLDMPLRGLWGNDVPVFLTVKDSHLFPVRILEIEGSIEHQHRKKRLVHKFKTDENWFIDKFVSRSYALPAELFEWPELYRILVKIHYLDHFNRKQTLIQDNYQKISHPPFQVFLARERLPSRPGWFWGDLHTHSYYTDDQVEFGAPIDLLSLAARTAGLHFIAITDHSYDLDDHVDNFMQNDRTLLKWNNFLKEVETVQENVKEFVIIPGEEVSAGNFRNRNVHCLILNDPQFHAGDGDSAEKPFHNQPTLSVVDLIKNKHSLALAVAAHPCEKPPLTQKFILRRDVWHERDFRNTGVDILQIMNDEPNRAFYEGLTLWKKLLLKGERISIAAGNDAHGNFNSFRQIDIPFLKMKFNRSHLLGKTRTAVHAPELKRDQLLTGLKSHRSIISSGPFAAMEIFGSRSSGIGDLHTYNPGDRIRIWVKSTAEFGFLCEVTLYFGISAKGREIERNISLTNNIYQIEEVLNFPEEQADYIRLEAFSRTREARLGCWTNPIWIEKDK